MDIKKADNKGRITGFTPGNHYFLTGPLDGKWSIKEVPQVEVAPPGYLPAEVIDAQNAVLDLLYDKGLDSDGTDLIGLSASIVDLFETPHLTPSPVVRGDSR